MSSMNSERDENNLDRISKICGPSKFDFLLAGETEAGEEAEAGPHQILFLEVVSLSRHRVI